MLLYYYFNMIIILKVYNIVDYSSIVLFYYIVRFWIFLYYGHYFLLDYFLICYVINGKTIKQFMLCNPCRSQQPKRVRLNYIIIVFDPKIMYILSISLLF